VLSSTSTRCTQTLAPFAKEHVVPLEELEELSEEGYDEAACRAVLDVLMAAPGSSALCSHRPVLPDLFTHLGVDEEPLAAGELVVVHHRKGRLVASERHLPM
jgi:8-oxo-dGTP diphosphatase